MAIEFKENPFCPVNVQCISRVYHHFASIDKFSLKVTYMVSAPVSICETEQILAKMKELQEGPK